MLTAIFLRGFGKTTVGVETEAGDKTREVVLGIANKLDWSTNFPVA